MLWRGDVVECPGYPVVVADTVGADDAFSAAFLHGWISGWGPHETGDFENRIGARIASRAGAPSPWSRTELLQGN